MANTKFLLYSACIAICLATTVNGSRWPNLDKLMQSEVSPDVQAITVKGLVRRVLGTDFMDKISISIDANFTTDEGNELFSIVSEDNVLKITGTTGVAAATGLGFYLKNYCSVGFFWSGLQLRSLPQNLPVITDKITIPFNDKFRYYQNVCTVSYSSVWWDFNRWEQEIDWMALNGINLPLAFTGQEDIFRKVYLKMGFTQEDLDRLFAGPAFLAWGRMANIDGWGGPLPEDWYQSQTELQGIILERMRDFGMIPVLPAFSGHVPRNFQTLFPDSNVTRLSNWNNFNETYCCSYLLDPNDEQFGAIGNEFIKEQTKAFGTNHIYAADVFNEMTPSSSDTSYLASVSRAVYKGMTGADPDAVWLIQGWFLKNSFWKIPQTKAWFTAVPEGSMIVLDLQAEIDPMYLKFESFYGQPFIWNMLHNFGGNLGLQGALDKVNVGPFEARNFPNTTIVGTGITMEGINQNEVVYEFMNEMAWLQQPVNLSNWVASFANRRYGEENTQIIEAWRILTSTVYQCQVGGSSMGHKILIKRPSLKLTEIQCYKTEDLMAIWDIFIQESDNLANSSLFRYDLADVTREVMQVLTTEAYGNIVKAFKSKDQAVLSEEASNLTTILQDLETLLASNENFLLGKWIQSAKKMSRYAKEQEFYVWNALNQITLWGPTGEIRDYAGKQWSGVVQDYYLPRWNLFTETLISDLAQGHGFNQAAYNQEAFDKVENPFTYTNKSYPTTVQGDTVSIAKSIYGRWRNYSLDYPTSTKFYDTLVEDLLEDADLIVSLHDILALEDNVDRGVEKLSEIVCRSNVCLDDIHKIGRKLYLLENRMGYSVSDSNILKVWKSVQKKAMYGELKCVKETCGNGWKIIV